MTTNQEGMRVMTADEYVAYGHALADRKLKNLRTVTNEVRAWVVEGLRRADLADHMTAITNMVDDLVAKVKDDGDSAGEGGAE
ncbi:MAG: hypothetical protein R3324_03405 [Halobacteriales archaeon]|nr:hypothetical protein [Halobacteriales archaeon]